MFSKVEGSFLGTELEAEVDKRVEWLMCSYGELEILDENDDSLEFALGIATQSGSSVALNGFDGRLGFRITVAYSLPPFIEVGGATVDLAIFPFSSHHRCWSELAGGSPGSIGSYPMRSSSSSESSGSSVAAVCPTSALRRSYSWRLISWRRGSFIILTVHWNVANTGR